ncbi:MAG TPA: AAA family ATPase, partial [Candidatus Tectomicrobia bacterium]
MDNDLSFGRWVKVRRVALGLTQAQLAERIGYSIVTIRKIESDGTRPSRQLMDKLAEGLALAGEERPDFARRARGEAGAEHRRHFIPEPGRPPPAPITPHPSTHLPAPVGPSTPPSPVALPHFLSEEPASVTRPAVFVGRTGELAELTATLETATSGKGQLLFVIGDAGRGKTTLVQEFARRAQQEDAALLAVSGHCNAYTGIGDPYLPFREVLATLVSDVEAKWSSGLLATQAARRLWEAMPITISALVEHAPDLIGPFVPAKALLAYAADFAPHAAWVQQLAKLTANDQHMHLDEKRLFAQYTAALKAMAAQRPLLLILEDLHWIDSASSSLLFHLSREIGDSPILIVGTYRPDELAGQGPERYPLLDMTLELKRQHGDIWLDLGNLSAVEGRHFVDSYLDTQPNRLGEAFRSAFFHHTGGHALFTVELLREMQERGDLGKDAEGYWIEGSTIDWQTLPAKVEGVIGKRIDRLNDGLRELLAVASVEGELFTAEVVAQVQHLPLRQVVRDLAQQMDKRHHLVREQGDLRLGGRRLARYQFVHALFQQFLYQELGDAEKRLLHGEVAHALEHLCAGQTDEISAQLAWHYDQADENDKAIDYLIVAGERAVRAGAPREARGHFQRALELLPLPEQARRWRALLGRESALTLLGDLAAQQADVSALLAMAAAANDDGWRAEAYQRQAEYVLRVHDYPLLIRVAEQAIAAARRSGQHALEARGHATKGVALGRIGQTQAARQSFEEALAHVHESGDAASISIVAHWATEHFASSGEWERAAQVSIEAVNMARSAADRHLEATALAGLGRAYIQLGLYDAAMETSQSAMKLHEMLGNRFQYAYAVLFLGMVHFRLGESAVAKAMLERQETEVVASEQFWHAVCSFILALIGEQMGDWETAAQRTRRARDLYSQIGAKARA